MHYSTLLFCTFAIFHCDNFWMFYFFHVALFSYCTFIHTEPFPCCTFCVVIFLCVAMFSFYIPLLLHSSHVAIFSCCTLFMLHYFQRCIHKHLRWRAFRGPGYASITSMLHFFIIEKCWKWTKKRKHNHKTTLHSAPWPCFTFILISCNTFLSPYSFECLIKWKGTKLLFCWKRICLPRLETFKTRMWIETYFSPT